MEWVETTGRTVDEAKEIALDRLGVDEVDAEFEVIDEPRPGLFGRMRGEARVRARVRPTTPRPKVERKGRRTTKTAAPSTASVTAGASDDAESAPAKTSKATRATKPAKAKEPAAVVAGNGGGASAERGTSTSESAPAERGASTSESAQAEARAAADFLDGLVAAFGFNGRSEIIELDVDDAEIRLEGEELGLLIGPRGQTLLAVQDLTRLAAQPRNGDRHGRLRVDIGGYRQRRQEALIRFTERVAQEVVASGTSKALEPMSSADRKIVHDAANGIAGVTTLSEGEEPFRRVVIQPAPGA